ncbi:MAG TPA: prepilin-type N-terminal cleavage/methylation domain-containing protein [Gemmatimonadales bacterium]|nr:prepilin-type N-terminal cleavage/methylation domain-containing protein [Gemmatimonadales bacterium]
MITRGFTLLEVLLALLVVSLGVTGLLATLGPLTALAADGRARGRVAAVLESRLDRMRLELQGAAPACRPPTSGTQRHGDGVVEWWSAGSRAGAIEVVIAAQLPVRGHPPDTLRSLLPCP